MVKYKVFCFFFVVSCFIAAPAGVRAAEEDKKITGNRGYLVGGPSAEEEVKVKEKKPERSRGRLEPIAEFEKHIQTYKEKRTDRVIPAKKGDIGPKGYLVGAPEEKPFEIKKERGKGGFAAGLSKLGEEFKEFNLKIRGPYPADQSLEGTKGGYIYGEAPAEEPEPEREITRTRGLKPFEFINVIGKGAENLHKTWNTRPHRSTDKEIWGFTFPDMPKEEKKGITKHRGDLVETVGSFVETIGADIERHKTAAPVDK